MDYFTVGDQGMGHFKVAFILVEIDESKKRHHSWCFQQRGFNVRIGMLSKWPEMTDKEQWVGHSGLLSS